MTLRRRAAHRRRRWFLLLLGLFLLYSLAGFLVLPPIIKAQAQKQLGAVLHRPVDIGRVRLNPWTLALTIEDFRVGERDGRADFLGWKRFYANFEVSSFFTGSWHFAAIELEAPRAWVLVQPDGSLNFSDLLAGLETPAASPAPAQAPAAAAKPVRIDRLVLRDAQLNFRDQSRPQPFATIFGPVGFTVTDFHTVGGEQAPYSFEAVTESGEKFAWHGWIESAPFRSGGELSVSGLVLAKYAPYYADRLGVDLKDGVLTVRGRYRVSFDEKTRALQLLDGSLLLRNLKLAERGSGEPLLEIPAIEITGATADGLTLKAAVQQVALKGGHLRLRREADGSLNLAQLVAPPPAAGAAAPVPAAAAPGAAPLALNVAETALQDWTIDVQDNTTPRPAQLGLTEFSALLKDFSLADGAAMPFEIAARWQPQGTVRAAGTVSLKPVQADVRLQIDSLGLTPLSPYLEQNLNARLADGDVSLQGAATVALPEGAAPALTFAGEVWLEKFSLFDSTRNEELAGIADLIVTGLKATTTPRLGLTVAEVNLNAPRASAIIDRDGSLNFSGLLKTPAPAAPPAPAVVPPAASSAGTGPVLAIGRVVINDGSFSFTDRSISPQARLAVRQFGGTLTGVTEANPAGGQLDLKANLGGTGPLTVKGRLDPFGPQLFADTQVELTRFDLMPFSPYLGKYAGYELARGSLTVDVKAKVAERRLDLANVVTLNQLTLGRATNSPDATKLPVRLGIALLKDLDGRIVLDVPVQGSLDDPEFRISRVVWRVIGNLLTKAAVSPFALLGSMFGGGGEELGYQEFALGDATLEPAALKKLETLTKALTARPGLSLSIEGGYDAPADTAALKRRKFDGLVRHTLWEERHAKEPALAPPEQLEIKPEDYAATVKKLFDRKFPPGTPLGTPLPPPPVVPPPPVLKESNLFWKVYDFVTLKKQRQRTAYEAAQKKTQQDYMKRVKAAADAGLPAEDMTGRLIDAMEVPSDELRELATARAQRVRDYFITEGHIASERLILAPMPESAETEGKGPRVFLQLQ